MVYDIIELVTLVFSIVAFVFIYKAYRKSKSSQTPRKIWTYFFILSIFLLLNRIFTNIEVFFYMDLFNTLEHLSILIASVVFLFGSWRASEEIQG